MFKPALIVVDVQEDFCPPHGSLAVSNGRDIVPAVNYLLNLPFALKVATRDWHPASHVSFASNHPYAEPFTSTTNITNPFNPNESYETRLWPVHCVQGTPGAELLPELDIKKVDRIVEKGQDARVEMYSAFYDPLKSPCVSDSGLAGVLKDHSVTDVYVVGLAADYCVQSTAVDASAEGFKTVIIEEATRAVDDKEWETCQRALVGKGVRVVALNGEEVSRVISLGCSTSAPTQELQSL